MTRGALARHAPAPAFEADVDDRDRRNVRPHLPLDVSYQLLPVGGERERERRIVALLRAAIALI